MEKITADKSDVLEILRTNRDAHRAIFEEAVEGYKAEATRQLEAHVRKIRAGKMYAVAVMLSVPEDHTKDYERAIRMLELHQADLIELSESDVSNYVMDDWRWKQQFLTSNSAYSATAAAQLGS